MKILIRLVTRATLALACFSACPAAAEEAPKDTPRAAFDRLVKAEAADDYAAWRAEFAPGERDDAEKWFDEVVKSETRRPKEVGSLAKAAGVSEEEVANLSAAQFAEKAFHHYNQTRPKEAGTSLYLSAVFEKGKRGEETATVEAFHRSAQVTTQSWVNVGNTWKYKGEVVIIPLSVGGKRKAGEICQDWQAAVLASDGKALMATYASAFQEECLRSWGPELGRLQEGDDAARDAAAKDLGLDASKFLSMHVAAYTEARLAARVKAWLEVEGHREAVEEMDFSQGKVEKQKATLPLKDGSLKPIRLEKDYEWKITSDCFDDERPGKK